MKDQLISFETAKLAKEKGFDNESNFYFCHTGVLCYDSEYPSLQPSKPKNIFYAPTQSLLQRWLREKHHIFVEPGVDDTQDSKITYSCWFMKKDSDDEHGNATISTDTYEECLEIGLIEGLKLIKL